MNYTSLDGFFDFLSEQELSELTDDNVGGDAVIDDDIITTHLNVAESKFDSYAGVLYSVPLTTTTPALTIPSVVTDFVYTVARYMLFKRRGIMEQSAEQAYTEAIKWVEALRDGIVVLPGVPLDTANEEVIYGHADASGEGDLLFNDKDFSFITSGRGTSEV